MRLPLTALMLHLVAEVAGDANHGGGGGGGANHPGPRCGGAGGKGIVLLKYRFQA